jgi:predicted ATP-grasp superfamily ATP-dependent carboligase
LNAKESQRVGEVIAAGTTEFTAQCYQLYQIPPLGSLVKTGDAGLELYAIVYNATTASIEPGRRPIARGKDETSEEAIYRSSPQLEKLLRSEFSALVVGHRTNDKVHHYLPPKPARIHSFVHLCPTQEVKEFSHSLGFLNIIINSQLPLPQDELIAACLRHMSQAHEDSNSFLVSAGKHLAALLSDDFNQLSAILERIRQ